MAVAESCKPRCFGVGRVSEDAFLNVDMCIAREPQSDREMRKGGYVLEHCMAEPVKVNAFLLLNKIFDLRGAEQFMDARGVFLSDVKRE